MPDWPSIFEERYPSPGAGARELSKFVRTFGAALSSKELHEIKSGQSNPFPPTDPLYASYSPFDPRDWKLPAGALPADYLNFLAWSNGGEFRTGSRWFQFMPAIDPMHGVRAMLLAYHIPQYMPLALPFAMDGGGGIYLFDMRDPAGEPPIVWAHAGSLGWRPDEHVQLGGSFLAACTDKTAPDEDWILRLQGNSG
ncbi:SMI1/KNR4 family protein [Prosthecobacter sp.]|uniref:SMI1/KNR4 family protein n=1 Tax=Prosthecobacter sp. TaxID=1965333 RepID=UPI0037832968